MRKLLAALTLSTGLVFAWGVSSAHAVPGIPDDADDTGDDFTSAVPEPTAAILMGLGLAAVAYTDRLRRR
jgi:hypothetical protein